MTMTELLSVKDLSIYRSRLPILMHLDLSIQEGEKLIITGDPGVGKSTLIEALLPGRVRGSGIQELTITGHFEGIPSTTKIVYLPQRYTMIYGTTVRSNLELLLEDPTTIPTVAAALHLTEHLDELVEALPKGLQKMLVLARLFGNQDASVYVLDEPFSSIGTSIRLEIEHLILRPIFRDPTKTLLFITHDTDVIPPWGSRILFLRSDGNILDLQLGSALRPRTPSMSFHQQILKETRYAYLRAENDPSRITLLAFDLSLLLEQPVQNSYGHLFLSDTRFFLSKERTGLAVIFDRFEFYGAYVLIYGHSVRTEHPVRWKMSIESFLDQGPTESERNCFLQIDVHDLPVFEHHRRPTVFGTSGIRFKLDEIRIEQIRALTVAFARVLTDGPIYLMRDLRPSSEGLMTEMIRALPIEREYVVLGIGSTPILYQQVRAHGGHGIMITASHNPASFNGFKLLDSKGAITDQKQREIAQTYETLLQPETVQTRFDLRSEFRTAPLPVRIGLVTERDPTEEYLCALETVLEEQTFEHRTIVVDLLGGSAIEPLLPGIARRFEIDLRSHRSATDSHEPTKDTMTELAAFCKRSGLVGCAFDGDADRVQFVDEGGRFIEGDHLGALLVRFSRHPLREVYVTHSCSGLIQEEAIKRGIAYRGCEVGAENLQRMIGHRSCAPGAVLGIENNGGVIFPELSMSKEAPRLFLRVLELLKQTGCSLSELVDRLFEKRAIQTYRWSIESVEPIEQAFERLNCLIERLLDRSQLSYKEQAFESGIRYRSATLNLFIRGSRTETKLRMELELINHPDLTIVTALDQLAKELRLRE